MLGNLPETEYDQYIRPQSLRDWGNEPFIAVNPVDPCQVVVTSFAYGVFIQSGQGATKASVWYSSDGGSTWNIRFPITQQPVPGAFVPNDQAIAYDTDGVLHGAFLTLGSDFLNVYHGSTPIKTGWMAGRRPSGDGPPAASISSRPAFALPISPGLPSARGKYTWATPVSAGTMRSCACRHRWTMALALRKTIP